MNSIVYRIIQGLKEKKDEIPGFSRISTDHFLVRNRHVGYSLILLDKSRVIPLYVCKVALLPAMKKYLLEELQILTFLNSVKPQTFSFSNPLAEIEYEDFYCTVYEWIDAQEIKQTQEDIPSEKSIFWTLIDIATQLQSLTINMDAESQRKDVLFLWRRNLETFLEPNNELIECIDEVCSFWIDKGFQSMHSVLMHGDLFIKNTLITRKERRVFILDWEVGLRCGFAFFDFFSLFHLNLLSSTVDEFQAFQTCFIDRGPYRQFVENTMSLLINKVEIKQSNMVPLIKVYLMKRVGEIAEHTSRLGKLFEARDRLLGYLELLKEIK